MKTQWPASILLSLTIIACGPRNAVDVPGEGAQPPAPEGGDPVDPPPSGEEMPCPSYADGYGWHCAPHLEALYHADKNNGTAWCEGDVLMDCAFALELCEGKRLLDAIPSGGTDCPAGCEDDLQGGAHCVDAPFPVEPECSEATCKPGVSCSLTIEGTGTCDPPAGGGCSCDDGVWSCFSGCPEGCSEAQPEQGAACDLAAGQFCRYYDGDTCDCHEGTWRCCAGGPCS